PSPKNPGSYEWSYQDLKLICSDGSSITADGVHLAYHGDGAPFYKVESRAREPQRYALTQYDSTMFLVEKKKLAVGGMKLQVMDLPPIPLTEDKRGKR